MCEQPSIDLQEFEDRGVGSGIPLVGAPRNLDRGSTLELRDAQAFPQRPTVGPREIGSGKVRIDVGIGILKRQKEPDPGIGLLVRRAQPQAPDEDGSPPPAPSGSVSTAQAGKDRRICSIASATAGASVIRNCRRWGSPESVPCRGP